MSTDTAPKAPRIKLYTDAGAFIGAITLGTLRILSGIGLHTYLNNADNANDSTSADMMAAEICRRDDETRRGNARERCGWVLQDASEGAKTTPAPSSVPAQPDADALAVCKTLYNALCDLYAAAVRRVAYYGDQSTARLLQRYLTGVGGPMGALRDLVEGDGK